MTEQSIASSSSTLNKEEYLILEQSTLKAPLENLRRLQKVTQKTYEHNLGPNSSFIKDLNQIIEKTKDNNNNDRNIEVGVEEVPQTDLLQTIDGMLGKMRGLKKKLTDLSAQSTKTIQITSTRLNHLKSIPESINEPHYSQWTRKRLSHHLVDYFLRMNPPLKESASSLAKAEGIEEMVDFDLWDELAKGEEGLKAGRLTEVLTWSGENRSALRKLKSPLEFTIHLQAYIELCRSRSLGEAITYVKKFLSPIAANSGTTHLAELNQVMALLAFSPDTKCSPYQQLYAQDRWTSLASLFRSTFLSLHSLPSLPLLHVSLQAGLASLKTSICCPRPSTSTSSTSEPAHSTTASTKSTLNTTCPVCSSPLKELATEVPYSHHLNSTIVCALSGEVVEGGGGEAGQLVALVSKNTGEGRVYSRKALELRISNDPMKRLTDPQTGEIFSWQEVHKVFIS